MESIQYDGYCDEFRHRFLWSEDQAWKPSGAVSNITLRDLPAEGICLVYDNDGPMDYVQVLPQFSFAASTVDGLDTNLHYCSCNVIQCGKRPGESHEGVGRKKDLPAEGTFLAMQKEIRGLTAVGVDQVLAENVARESGQHIIGTRWVTNEKEEAQEGVRARIVAKDFASGQSARSMGIMEI